MANVRDLLDDARWVDGLSIADAEAVLVELAHLQSAVAKRLRTAPMVSSNSEAIETDRLLTAEDVAERFGRSVAWVYRQAKHWSFTRRVTRRTVRFSEAGLRKFLAQRRAFDP